ncbi:MAG TPA: phosphatase domain-containing protein [Cytophagales bacterium]|nr:phosphatase domain-containing protein [Cytophagales bacterium]
MSDLKEMFSSMASGVEQNFDDLMFRVNKRLKLHGPLQIIPYRSYGTAHRLYIKGRVLEDKGIRPSTKEDSLWSILLDMYKRFESDEVPNATIQITFEGKSHTIVTDDEGYFILNISPAAPLLWNSWHEVEIELTGAPIPMATGIKTKAQVLVPPIDAEFGIISDIDDTIVKTTATNLLAMSRNVFLNNAHSRLPFPGVSEFYKALQLGKNGKQNNPFFYVSSSPWNLYDLLVDFLDINKIPAGPLLLRDFGFEGDKFISSDHMGHKFYEIENILLTYPLLNFVLIGDSGQEDPKIYKEIVRKYPKRILAVYIRDVDVPERKKIALDISKELQEDKVEMVIVSDTVEAASHAAGINLVYRETIPEIEVEKKLDTGEIPGKEPLKIT